MILALQVVVVGSLLIIQVIPVLTAFLVGLVTGLQFFMLFEQLVIQNGQAVVARDRVTQFDGRAGTLLNGLVTFTLCPVTLFDKSVVGYY